MWLRQSTASQEISLGQFLDSTDGNTEENALTIANTDIKLRKCGTTTLANKNSGGATNISNGVYHATLDATDSNTLGLLEVYVHVAGALATKATYIVLPAATYDALVTNGLNNFDASSDAVANVTLVATTTLNTDMRGTDSANTVTPPSVAQFDARTILSASYGTSANQTTINSNVLLIDTAPMRGTDNALLASGYTAPDNAGITQIQADISNLNNISVSDIFTEQMVESYSADGVAPTLAQSLFLTMQNLQDFSFTGTTQTVKRLDGSTTAATYTLDDAVTPTSKTRAS